MSPKQQKKPPEKFHSKKGEMKLVILNHSKSKKSNGVSPADNAKEK